MAELTAEVRKKIPTDIMPASAIFELVTREMRKRGFVPAVDAKSMYSVDHDAMVMRFYRHGIDMAVAIHVTGLEQRQHGKEAMRGLLLEHCKKAEEGFDRIVARGTTE